MMLSNQMMLSNRPLMFMLFHFTVHDQAILVGLDGWHISRAKIDVFSEPQIAHDRRGGHRTFDGAGYVR